MSDTTGMHHAGKQNSLGGRKCIQELQGQQKHWQGKSSSFLMGLVRCYRWKGLENHKWSKADKEIVGIIFDKLEQKCHPASNQTLYKKPLWNFLDLYYEVWHMYDLCTFEVGRCETHKDYQG